MRMPANYVEKNIKPIKSSRVKVTVGQYQIGDMYIAPKKCGLGLPTHAADQKITGFGQEWEENVSDNLACSIASDELSKMVKTYAVCPCCGKKTYVFSKEKGIAGICKECYFKKVGAKKTIKVQYAYLEM